jgi:L-lactate dehydrogenase complex protein LldF
VKIDLDAQLYRWRQLVTDAGHVATSKRVGMRAFGEVASRPRLFDLIGALGRAALRVLPARFARTLAGPWGRAREIPVAPAQSFRAWYRKREETRS